MNQYQDALDKITPVMADKFEKLLFDLHTAIHSISGKTFPNLQDAEYAIKKLPDAEYILFKAWGQKNRAWFMNKHFPNVKVFDGSKSVNNMIIFHGGCLGCSSQNNYLIEVRCAKCQYYKADWSKEDLSI